MNDAELNLILEELGDCMEDMARAVDRSRSVMKRMFHAVQSMKADQQEIRDRVQRLEDENAAERLSQP